MAGNSRSEAVEKQTEDLRALIAKKQIVAIVGSGVSIATTERAPTASWDGLLKSGIAHCEQFAPGLTERWGQRQRESLEDALRVGDLFEMLTVAEQVCGRLGAPDNGEYIRWLRESLSPEALPVKDDAVIQALDAPGTPLVTTNYDDLIERVIDRPGVSWKERHKIPRIVRGEDRAVLHLHGKWDDPISVVLGIRDYNNVKNDEHTQAVMQALGLTKSLLFVGCGEGLDDPNFKSFLQWLGRVKVSHEDRSYRLARTSEVSALQDKHAAEQRLFVLPYGDDFSDLPGFLEAVCPDKSGLSETAITSCTTHRLR
jgi:hypothetical protein